MKKILLVLLAITSSPVFATEVDRCTVIVEGNTSYVTRVLSEKLTTKRYHVIDSERRNDAWYMVYSQREGCPVPFMCGGSTFHIYFQAPMNQDPSHGYSITQDWADHDRAEALNRFDEDLKICPDAQ